jgi:alkylation response protein AidB-like acyl-CoA dehydrogenase
VYATTKPGAGMTKGTSCFLVPRGTPGLSVARCNETLGGRYMNNGEIALEDCAVPKDHLLVQDTALSKAGVYFRPGKIIQGSKNLGVAVRAFEETAKYVQDYVQGGQILIKHQATALRLAEMATKICAVRGLLREASRAVDEKNPEAEVLCNMVKLYASEAVLDVCRHAMELHGGNGTMLDFGIEKLYRDASMYLHMDGTVDITKFKIIKNLFPETAGKYAGPDK